MIQYIPSALVKTPMQDMATKVKCCADESFKLALAIASWFTSWGFVGVASSMLVVGVGEVGASSSGVVTDSAIELEASVVSWGFWCACRNETKPENEH